MVSYRSSLACGSDTSWETWSETVGMENVRWRSSFSPFHQMLSAKLIKPLARDVALCRALWRNTNASTFSGAGKRVVLMVFGFSFTLPPLLLCSRTVFSSNFSGSPLPLSELIHDS